MPSRSTSANEPNLTSEAQGSGTTRLRGSRVWIGVSLCAIVLLAGAGVPGYRWWKQRRTDQFKAACLEATAEERWERLGLAAETWLAWDPSSNDAHLYLAEAQFQAGRLDEAADSLARVSNDYHGAIEALTFRGEILYGNLHQPYAAETNWQRMLEIDPDNLHAHQRLITFYAVSLQRGRMIDQIRESLRLRCEPPEAYACLVMANVLGFTEGLVHVRNWRKNVPEDEILEVAEAIYATKYSDTPVAVDEYADSHFVSGDQTLIKLCLQKYPRNLEVLAFHLDKQIFFGNTSEVLALLKSAPPEAMQDSRFWRARGWLLGQSKNREQAIDAFEKSIDIDRFDWRSRWELASLLRLLGHSAEAAQIQQLAMRGKVLQDKLYETDGRALTWGLVEELRDYVSRVDEPLVLAALDARIRRQGGENVAIELIEAPTSPVE